MSSSIDSSASRREPSNVSLHYESQGMKEHKINVSKEDMAFYDGVFLSVYNNGLSLDRSERNEQLREFYDFIHKKEIKAKSQSQELSPYGSSTKKMIAKWVVINIICASVIFGISQYRGW